MRLPNSHFVRVPITTIRVITLWYSTSIWKLLKILSKSLANKDRQVQSVNRMKLSRFQLPPELHITDWFFFLEPNYSYDESTKNHKSVIQSDVMNSICNGYCGRLCLGGNFTECGACPWGWMMNHSDYYLVQPDYYLAQPQICYPCENTFDSYDWLFIIFNFGMLYMLHAQAILRFSGKHL